jgi:hypothetical protein
MIRHFGHREGKVNPLGRNRFKMSETYSKTEIDAKLESVEERIDHNLSKMISQIEKGFEGMYKRFELVDKDIAWLKALMFLGLGLLLGLLFKH